MVAEPGMENRDWSRKWWRPAERPLPLVNTQYEH
jgi:hypothetical protein